MMKCIAHRGYSLKYRDNSEEAVSEAIKREYDGVEIDVQLCKSGELVLFHDVYVGGRFVYEMTLEELLEHDVHSLRDMYKNVPEIRNTLVLVDIKGNNLNVCEALRVFYSDESCDDVIFCSFNRNIIYTLPSYFKKGSTFETTFRPSEFDTLTENLSAVVLHWTCLDEAFITHCKDENIRVFTYTHKDDKELEYMCRYDVDGIITNGIG